MSKLPWQPRNAHAQTVLGGIVALGVALICAPLYLLWHRNWRGGPYTLERKP